ncbi:hypothetical protein [Streptomyces sp. NBC_00690]|uniref:hypothetical protein n=1 Tax=Streptomyces sp. NBC_00690 TaxID=2975808 RepID=UPI002E2AB6AC|nr:hypothetical protein [Streptomyces sp. NBC_00690]
MSQQVDLTTIQQRLDELAQRVSELERTVDRLGGADDQRPGSTKAPGHRPTARVDLVTIPDVPYDNALWTDSDDEGLGVRDRRAP